MRKVIRFHADKVCVRVCVREKVNTVPKHSQPCTGLRPLAPHTKSLFHEPRDYTVVYPGTVPFAWDRALLRHSLGGGSYRAAVLTVTRFPLLRGVGVLARE